MKKSLIALAVAGAVSAPAFADVGGFGGMGLKATDDGTNSDTQVIGIFGLNASGETQTDGGSTVYGNLSLTSSNGEMHGQNGGNFSVTGAVVGIKGDFGNLFLGNGGSGVHYAQLAGDRFDVSDSDRTKNAIGYDNTFGAISFRVTSDPSDSNGETVIGAGEGTTSVGLQGVFGGVTVGVGQEEDDTTVGASMGFGDIGLAIHSTQWDVADDDSLAIKISYSAGAVSAYYMTETMDGTDNTRGQLQIGYSLGGGAALTLRNRTDDLVDANEYTRLMLSLGF